MDIISFNANGLRSAASKGFFDWFAAQQADILAVQETKAQEAQLAASELRPAGYHVHFKDAITRKGYSGVGIYSKKKPDAVLTELGWREFDDEGRYIECRFGNLSVVSLYVPSGSSGDIRQQFKFVAMERLAPIFRRWLKSGRDYVICGDWNIVRSERDIRNWKSNQKNSGCLPEEREWLNSMCAANKGWVDSYRQLHPEGEDYTWWSQRGAARAKNVGWRLDYQLLTPGLAAKMISCEITSEPKFSDHAPFRVSYAD